jgi:hypothetical protein
VRARIIARLGAVLIIMWGVVLWATVVVAGARAAATDRNQQRWVSYWLSLSHVNATVAMDTLRAAGGSNVATSVFADCGDSIQPDGTLQVGRGSLYPWAAPCDSLLPAQLDAMGVGLERLIQSKGGAIGPLRAMFAQPQRSIDAIVALARAQKLRGISWDVEPETDATGTRLTYTDAVRFADYLTLLRSALSPMGVRLSVYNNVYSPLISNFSLLQHSVDRLLDGDTYVYSVPACGEPWFPSIRCSPGCNVSHCDPSVSNFTKWVSHYHNTAVNSKVSRDKVGIAMMATTEGGEWNCLPASMRRRAAQLAADDVPELAIFELFPMPSDKCSTNSSLQGCTCADAWFPVARDFLAGTLAIRTDDEEGGDTNPPRLTAALTVVLGAAWAKQSKY